MGSGGFFPTNPDLADILGRTDFDFEIFHFLVFLVPNIFSGICLQFFMGETYVQEFADLGT